VAVAVAGAIGALARYGIGTAVGRRSFPWATLGINVVGAFLLGFVLAYSNARGWSSTVTTAIAVGFLGTFTTFSTFAFEGFTLFRTERAGEALAYLVGSVVIAVLAAWGGFHIGTTVA
jgi:fluoride exporter